MEKKGFVFVESLTVIIIVILSLTLLISSYGLVTRKSKENESYDLPADKYLLYVIGNLGENNEDYNGVTTSFVATKDNCSNFMINRMSDCSKVFEDNDLQYYIVIYSLNLELNSGNPTQKYDSATIEYLKTLKKCNSTSDESCDDAYVVGVFKRNNKFYYVSLKVGTKEPTNETSIITLNANGGTIPVTSGWTNASDNKTATKELTYGNEYGELPTPVRTNYLFAGWEDENNNIITSSSTVSIAGDHTLTAVWSSNKYMITFDHQGANSSTYSNCWYYYNIGSEGNYYYADAECNNPFAQDKIPTLPVKNGYGFNGYYTEPNGGGTQYVDASGYFINDLYSSEGNRTLYANWGIQSYTLTISQGMGTTITVSRLSSSSGASIGTLSDGAAIYYNDVLQISYSASTGYTVNSHTVNSETFTSGSNYTVTGDVIITTTSTETSYTITFDKQSGSNGTNSVDVCYGSNMPTISAPTRTGYLFGGYYTGTNGGGTQYYNSNGNGTRTWDISSNTTLYAKWTYNGSCYKVKSDYHPYCLTVPDNFNTSVHTYYGGEVIHGYDSGIAMGNGYNWLYSYDHDCYFGGDAVYSTSCP